VSALDSCLLSIYLSSFTRGSTSDGIVKLAATVEVIRIGIGRNVSLRCVPSFIGASRWLPASDEASVNYSGQAPFADITTDFLEARFWISSGLPLSIQNRRIGRSVQRRTAVNRAS
jgi:hypothetical protein